MLDIPKIEAIISFFVDNVMVPFKTKMMKLLWYADALAYKESGKAMTGLVYVHEKLGALPQGHKELVNLDNLHVSEEFSPNYDTILRFNPAEGIDYSILSKDEMSVLERVAKKFKNYSAAEIIDYMHKERAYEETKQDDLISFELAKAIRRFRS